MPLQDQSDERFGALPDVFQLREVGSGPVHRAEQIV
jgi:hypothetical protein